MCFGRQSPEAHKLIGRRRRLTQPEEKKAFILGAEKIYVSTVLQKIQQPSASQGHCALASWLYGL